MSVPDILHVRFFLFASLFGDRTSRMKSTARRHVHWVWNLSCENDPFVLELRIGDRYDGYEGSSVGMFRISDHV